MRAGRASTLRLEAPCPTMCGGLAPLPDVLAIRASSAAVFLLIGETMETMALVIVRLLPRVMRVRLVRCGCILA